MISNSKIQNTDYRNYRLKNTGKKEPITCNRKFFYTDEEKITMVCNKQYLKNTLPKETTSVLRSFGKRLITKIYGFLKLRFFFWVNKTLYVYYSVYDDYNDIK